MHKASTALLVFLAASLLGVWGCSHQQSTATNAKIRELENRYAKLEEDYRVVAAANDVHRKKLTQLETQRVALAQQVEELQGVVKERDDLKQQLTERTRQRDAVHAQFAQFSKDVQSLAGRIESAVAAHSFGSTLAVGIPASRKSE